MTDALTDKKSEPEAKAPAKKADWVAAQNFGAELHGKDVQFAKDEDIPGNIAQKTLDAWDERGLIRKNT